MEGVLLGLQCPLEAGLLPEGVQPREGGEGEGRAVALVLGSPGVAGADLQTASSLIN